MHKQQYVPIGKEVPQGNLQKKSNIWNLFQYFQNFKDSKFFGDHESISHWKEQLLQPSSRMRQH